MLSSWHFLYFGRFSFQVIKPEQLETVTLLYIVLSIAVTELIQAIAAPGCALPDSKQASAALSFQLGTWCKHCWSTTIRICIIFEFCSFCSCWRASSQLHPFCIIYFTLCLFWDNKGRKCLITYMLLYVLCSNEGKWKTSIFCGRLEVCQNLLSWSWEDLCCTSVKEINHLVLKNWIKEIFSQHFTANLTWATRANYLIAL